MCRKRNVSSIASCGRISSLRTSARQLRARGPAPVRRELGERLPLEVEADDGGSLEHVALLVGKRVEASGEERLDRRRQLARARRPRRASRAAARRTAGCPRRPRGSASASRSSSVSAAEELVDQLVGLVVRRAARARSVGVPCRTPGRALVDSSGRARQRRSSGASRVQSTRCSSRSSSVGSAQWMSSTTSASGCSRARRSSALRTAQKTPPARSERRAPRRAPSSAPRRGEDLASGQYVMPSPYGGSGRRARVASPRERRRRPRAASRDLPIPGGPSTVTSRHRRSETALVERGPHASRARRAGRRAARRAAARSAARPRRRARGWYAGTRLGLPLQRKRLDALDLDRVAGERERPLAEQDLARAGRLLEPGGDVDRVAGRQPLAGVSLSGHDLAGVDADPRLERDAVVALEIAVQRGEPLAHLVRRANRAERVVLVERRARRRRP